MWNSGMIDIGRPEQGNATEIEEGGGVNKNQNINQDCILFLTYLTDFLNICANGRNVALMPLMSMQKMALS